MLALLKNRWFLALIGLLLLALIIWFGGPYIAIAEAKPLDGVTGRLIAIIALMVIYALTVTIKQLNSKKASQRLAAGAAKQDESTGGSKGSMASGEAQQLSKRFEEATAALKKSKKGGRNLYELPWYIIVGPPGSGKTTVLVNSGLNSLHHPRFQQSG